MNITDLLALGEPIFLQIDEAVEMKDFEKAYKLLNSPQPIEWIKEMPSEATEGVYYHNDIELLEAICDRIFEGWGYAIIHEPSILTTKTGVVITITVKCLINFKGSEFDYPQHGIASEFVSNPKFIPLASPKTASLAYKNGMKKYGRLFGRDLNRGIENAPIEPQNVVRKISKEEERLKALLDDAVTKEDLDSFKLMVASSTDYIKDYYKTKIEEKLKS